MIVLSELQQDALIELFNIAIHRAAASLGEIIQDEVGLNIPEVHFCDQAAAITSLSSALHTDERMCAVVQGFEGSFSADALLLFPESNSVQIARLIVGDMLPIEEVATLEQEALSEVGNIVLNACLGTFANLLSQRFSSSLPQFLIGSAAELLRACERPDSDMVLLLNIHFSIQKRAIHGTIAFLMGLPSVREITNSLQAFLNMHLNA